MATPAVAEPEVQGSERGSAGALALGAAVAGLDNPDFVYGYYVDQMLSMIQRNWVRPMVGSGVEATVHYQSLQTFCSEDLGGFYLDILKDRLYTTAAASARLPRRIARRQPDLPMRTLRP